ncbi:Allantoate amidohydrolase [Ewingella americana]|uniref:Allantoate amidohydrolase n=1 Tax=Ewingella americana TaxID=41202 RepID=A0A377NH82_9GAMM|nr:Allantoate amidohydrolase [Ewingella americana]
MQNFPRQIQDISAWLSQIGADPTGGMTRLLYTPEWCAAQRALQENLKVPG